LAAESPLLSFLPQGQKVFIRTAGASRDLDNVSRLPVEAARKGNQPAQLRAWVSRSSVQVPQQTGDVGLRIRLVEQRKQHGSLGSIHRVDRRHRDTRLACDPFNRSSTVAIMAEEIARGLQNSSTPLVGGGPAPARVIPTLCFFGLHASLQLNIVHLYRI
jgi:hypothetical protein